MLSKPPLKPDGFWEFTKNVIILTPLELLNQGYLFIRNAKANMCTYIYIYDNNSNHWAHHWVTYFDAIHRHQSSSPVKLHQSRTVLRFALTMVEKTEAWSFGRMTIKSLWISHQGPIEYDYSGSKGITPVLLTLDRLLRPIAITNYTDYCKYVATIIYNPITPLQLLIINTNADKYFLNTNTPVQNIIHNI